MRSLAMLLLLLLAAPALAAEPDDFAQGMKLLRSMDDEGAEIAFERALRTAGSDKKRALVHLHIGIARMNLLDEFAAREAFREALAAARLW